MIMLTRYLMITTLLYHNYYTFQTMVSVIDLVAMDDPTGHVDYRLLDPSTFVRSSAQVPLRHPNHNFKRFNSNDGRTLVEGADDHQLSNPRCFGKYFC